MVKFTKCIFMLAIMFPPPVYATEAWSLKKDSDDIQIFTRKVEGSKYKMVRGITQARIPLPSAVALVRDSGACADWADLCAKSSVYKTISPTEDLVYTLNNLPWPVSDRDVIARVSWQQDPKTHAVTMVSKAIDGEIDKNKGIVRLTEAMSKWIFTPLPDGRLEIVTEAHLNPGGPLPAWITNMLLIDSPYNTLKSFREAVLADKYQSATFDFIVEPSRVR